MDYFILFYFVLFYVILFYVILFYLFFLPETSFACQSSYNFTY